MTPGKKRYIDHSSLTNSAKLPNNIASSLSTPSSNESKNLFISGIYGATVFTKFFFSISVASSTNCSLSRSSLTLHFLIKGISGCKFAGMFLRNTFVFTSFLNSVSYLFTKSIIKSIASTTFRVELKAMQMQFW
jgi:hypothetical protein